MIFPTFPVLNSILRSITHSGTMNIVLRSGLPMATLQPAITSAVREADPSLPGVPVRDLGEHKTNVLRWPSVALRTCTVSFTGSSGIRHSVEVTAESVFEAAALGVSALKKNDWADAIAPGTELEIQVREPPTSHRIRLQQIHRWCDGIAVSPDDTLKRRRLKHLLA
jgi:hypothetical protein